MRQIITRLLKLLIKLGFLGRYHRFTYQGESLSLNKFYTQGHWGERDKIRKRFHDYFNPMIDNAPKDLFFERYYLLIFFNNRLDVDNVVGMEKVFTDCLKGRLVHNDNKQYYKGMMIFYDQSLPKNSIEFILIEVKQNDYNDKKRTRFRYNSKGH